MGESSGDAIVLLRPCGRRVNAQNGDVREREMACAADSEAREFERLGVRAISNWLLTAGFAYHRAARLRYSTPC